MNLAKYIVLTENKKEVRFFAIGLIDDNETFTGIMHDYTGGGNNEERLVVKDRWVPDSIDDEPLDWDEQVELFDSMSPYTVDQIETEMDEFIVYDTEAWNYVPQNGTMRYYDKDGVFVDDMKASEVPYGMGHTSFEHGYQIDEVLSSEEITRNQAIKSFRDNLDNADVIRIDSSPLLESWEIFIDLGDFDLISTSWSEEEQVWEYGLNEDNIKSIRAEKNHYKIEKYDSKNEDTITLYKLKTLVGDK